MHMNEVTQFKLHLANNAQQNALRVSHHLSGVVANVVK